MFSLLAAIGGAVVLGGIAVIYRVKNGRWPGGK